MLPPLTSTLAIRARIALIIHTDITDTIKSTYFNEIASLLSPLWLIKIPHGSQNPILLWNLFHCPPQTIAKAKEIFFPWIFMLIPNKYYTGQWMLFIS